MSDPITIDPDDPEVKWILGCMCFITGPIAEVLRISGQAIPRKIEAEQAAVMTWMLRLYLEHGAGWKRVADQKLEPFRHKKPHE